MAKRKRKNEHAVALGRRGGKVKSDAKTTSARANGKLGGRPKKRTESATTANRKRALCVVCGKYTRHIPYGAACARRLKAQQLGNRIEA